ncbi:MAG: sulfite exporter TauE/SafE family protein [Rhodopseudomonas palustris]|uniref:Sulfite exporter TauE/SafE family protein n=1 Tax=Rhodopseudomonas palustris TaxID=1076 RepID=A0A933VVX1_RHOPL|nr:sulfite exporter TauE/SafE family protein [Rhodopseudomonas palustris]
MLQLVLAFLAGVATIAAPCTLPMLPVLLGASLGHPGRLRPTFITLGFVLSFSAVALSLGWLARIGDFDPGVLRSFAAILLMVFGLLMIWPTPFELWWSRTGVSALLPAGAVGGHPGAAGGFALGAALGLVWTPCAGPVLGSILTLVATSKDTAWAGTLLVSYALGAGVPMLAVSYGGQQMVSRIRSVSRISPRLQQAFGVLVIAVAVATYFQYDTLIVAWLTTFYPTGQIGL